MPQAGTFFSLLFVPFMDPRLLLPSSGFEKAGFKATAHVPRGTGQARYLFGLAVRGTLYKSESGLFDRTTSTTSSSNALSAK